LLLSVLGRWSAGCGSPPAWGRQVERRAVRVLKTRYSRANSAREETMKAAALALSCLLSLPIAAQAADPLPRAKPESVGISSERLALIRKQIDAETARAQLRGAVRAIARRGKLVHFEAYGYLDKAAGIPMRTDAIFSIASMTKPMVAVAGLQLYEQGRL